MVPEGDVLPGGLSVEIRDRELSVLNPNSAVRSGKPAAGLITSLWLFPPCKPGIKTFTCPSGRLWRTDWQMTVLPFTFSMCHIKAVLLVGGTLLSGLLTEQ